MILAPGVRQHGDTFWHIDVVNGKGVLRRTSKVLTRSTLPNAC
jgi:hypothetical protein